MEPDLFDFVNVNGHRREGQGAAPRNASSNSSHPMLHRLPVPRRSLSDDALLQAPHTRPSQAQRGHKRSRRFMPPFKRIGGRVASTSGEPAGNSDHAVASLSSNSRTTLSSKSRCSHALHDDGEISAHPRRTLADSVLPIETFTMTRSDDDHDCISEVSIDYVHDGRFRAHNLCSSSSHRSRASATMATRVQSTTPLTQRERVAGPQSLGVVEEATHPCQHPATTTTSGADDDGDGCGAIVLQGSTMVEVVSGSFVALIGTRDTMEAYRLGSVVDQPCLGCNEFLLCSERATLVICPVCRIISPVAGGASYCQDPSSNRLGEGLLGLGLTVPLIEAEFLRVS